MTWPWLICFSLTVAAVINQAATITGTVALIDSRSPQVRKKKDFSGVVVWLDPVGPPARAPVSSPRPAEMVQKGKKFTPHVLAIPVGASVEFPNFDPICHNAFS